MYRTTWMSLKTVMLNQSQTQKITYYRGVGKSRLTVVHMENNNTVISKQ